MYKGMLLFIVGLIMYMAGIYLSTIWAAVGTAIGVFGGLLMGISTYFYSLNAKRKS
ncbi:hypothetical protein LC048_10360 [Mesobacillus subterraneus]|uniref:hypothetical protein n=1 Tax=Mesobacillus subterraneus TaxID=285983 RepID=UPI001CFE8D7F|nr:hypothetical protein [Mesobacillus subterraneus]WLR57222.1 hypothetical protein LC048_10360 [Mesobacillus subterraneus]